MVDAHVPIDVQEDQGGAGQQAGEDQRQSDRQKGGQWAAAEGTGRLLEGEAGEIAQFDQLRLLWLGGGEPLDGLGAAYREQEVGGEEPPTAVGVVEVG